MPYDEGIAAVMREDLAGIRGIAEKKMFGGLAFMLEGNLVCGAYRDRGMFRVGKAREAEARAVPGTREMDFNGRPMGGMVEALPGALADDETRGRLMALALDHARSLPAKPPSS